ncbi:tRNA (cytidine(34)-2'-O)-methyltransferase [uncultured Brachyspira sp.]|uniref:tRNA (cytidine(34)-2'-O)-methyltransferase n=1 Tax=uncultured Brachyspira sp. TaxID=221953 RepID=UPI00261F2760|nr:tRNA (cytidine(34)-2'-O)-methyltransferase [uncultured Brachyspira sp.]
MFRIVLLEPEIPQNTGNIARLCASTGIELILVGRLGFSIDDKYLKRAAMDYWEHVNVTYIKTLDEYFEANNNFYAISTKGHKNYTEITININSKIDILFGSEGAGLPNFVYEKYTDRLYRIPMKTESRSLNLSSSTAIVSYHLLYKLNFPNLF